MSDRMMMILDRYLDKRAATDQLLVAIRDNRKLGFQLVNMNHRRPLWEQELFASRLLLANSGVMSLGDDWNDVVQDILLKVFKAGHPLLDDARDLLSLTPPSNRPLV